MSQGLAAAPAFRAMYSGRFDRGMVRKTMSSSASLRGSRFDPTNDRTIRLLNQEIFDLRDQAKLGDEREVELAASLLAANTRLLDTGVMLDEVNHRAKNHLQIAMSLLALQMRASGSEEVRLELATAISRLGNIAAAQSMLNSQAPNEQLTWFSAYLTQICTQTHQSLGGERIAMIVETDELSLDTSVAINLAMIASEALTNAMKYAFPNGKEGTIRIECYANKDAAALTIIDDGIGFTAPLREGSLGLRLVRTLAKAIGGETIIDGSNGTRIEVRFPI